MTSRFPWIVLGFGGASYTFLFAYRFVLHHFASGPFLWDQGWYAYAIFQNGFLLPNPPYLRASIGESLFTQHMYGLVSLASPLSHAFSTHYHYFATVVGISHTLTFVGPFLVVMSMRESAQRTWIHAAVATVAGLAFALSGPAVSALGYPHFEIAVPAFFIVSLGLYLLGWRRAAWIPLALGLLVREDAGLHYLTYIAAIATYQRFTGRKPIAATTLASAAAVSLLVAVTMFALQRLFFPLGVSMLEKSFVGSPAFAHVTWTGARSRVSAFIDHAPAIYVPALFIAVVALLLRRPSFLLAYAACVPWIIVNVFFSLTPASQTLSLYYGFPLFVGMAWPLLSVHWDSSRSARLAVVVFVGACAVSAVVLPFHADVRRASRAGGSLPAGVYARQRRCLEAEFRSNSRLFADTAIAAMFPHSVPSRRVLSSGADVANVDADALVFYENEIAPSYHDRAFALGLQHSIVLKMPSIRLLSREASGFATCVGW